MPAYIPGSDVLVEELNELGATVHNLQHRKDKSGESDIILVPQPSRTNPNDPLLWPRLLKWATFLNGCGFAFNGSVLGPVLASGFLVLSLQYDKPISAISQFSGTILICQGMGNIFWMPVAAKYGRRPVYLASALFMAMTCLWAALVVPQGYTALLIARIFMGLAQAPVEAIVPSTVSDLFFLHERGTFISYYGLAVLGGNNIGPLFSAFLIQAKGVPWAFWLMLILCLVSWVSIVVAMPETKFRRPANPLQSDFASVVAKARVSAEDRSSLDKSDPEAKGEVNSSALATEHLTFIVPKRRPLSKLVPYIPSVRSRTALWKLFFRPWVLLAYPTVLWAAIVYGLSLGWLVIFSVAISQLMGLPPYSFDAQSQGLIYISPTIGSLIATWMAGSLSDMIATRATRLNGGLREPEHRLPALLPAIIITPVGAVIFGLCMHFATHWIGPVIGFGILTVGCQMGANLSMEYAVDCHKDLSAELMVTVAGLKSCIAYIFTWVINDWLADSGVLHVFLELAFSHFGLLVLITVPMWLYGKRIRIWLHDYDMFTRLNLNEEDETI